MEYLKEILKKEIISGIPESAEAFAELFQTRIGTVQAAAALFAAALAVTAADREAGKRCIDMISREPPEDDVFRSVFPEGEELAKTAASYFQREADGSLSVTVKVTDEKPLKKHYKTVYVGCSGTGSYRPITLVSRPPRYFKRRYGIRREFEEDPWLVNDFLSMLLPVAR